MERPNAKKGLSKIQQRLHYKKPWPWLLGVFVLYSLLGFFLVPYLIKTNLQNFSQERLGLQTQIESVRFNPWVFSLTINKLAMTEASGENLLGFERFYVNFQSSSLFRWAWSFDEVHLLGLYATVERFNANETNVGRIVETFAATQAEVSEVEEESAAADEAGAVPRLYFNDIQLQVARITVIDQVPSITYQRDLGPIDLQVQKLSTLPDRVGEQSVDIVTQQGARIRWSGDVSLAPVASAGQVEIAGPHLHLADEYLRDVVNFAVEEANIEANFRYDFSMQGEGPKLAVSQLNFTLSNFLLVETDSGEPLHAMDRLVVKNGSLKFPEQQAHIDNIAIHGGEVWVRRLQNGDINLNNLVKASNTASEPLAESEPEPETENASTPWRVTNNIFALRNWQVHFEDRSLNPAAAIDVDAIDLEVRNASTQANQAIAVQSSLGLGQGQFAAAADLTINPVANIAAKYSITDLQLAVLQPYLAAVSKTRIESGAFNVQGEINAETVDNLQVRAATQLNQLRIAEVATGNQLLGWRALAVDEANFNLAERTIQVNKVLLDELFADFAIAEDGTTTIDRVLIDSGGDAASTDGDEVGQSDEPPETSTQEAFVYTINQIEFNNGGGRFADANLPLPFATEMQKLNGTVSSLVSNSQSPGEVSLDGQVDEYGAVTIAGEIAAFAPTESANLNLTFENLNMPDLSPYTVKFAGREIDNGKMNLDLHYAIDAGILNSENDMALFDLQLGEKVEQPGAMDLPLNLALALLKDGDGKINLTVPVRGDVNDPEFGIGSLIFQALGAVIRSVVTSPFRFLGGLVGSDSDDLSFVLFKPGANRITPPELEKIHTLAEALRQRPVLKLKIAGVYAEDLDGNAMREQLFETRLSEQLGDDRDEVGRTSDAYIRAVETLFLNGADAEQLDAIAQSHTTVDPETNDESFDTLSYVNALRQILIEREVVAEQALITLAQQRGESVQQAFLTDAPELAARIEVIAAKAGDSKDDSVEMQLELAAE